MRYVISGLRLPFGADGAAAEAAARRTLRLPAGTAACVCRRSFDLRHGALTAVFAVSFEMPDGWRAPDRPDLRARPEPVLPPVTGSAASIHPPVVVGFGPAGLFAALALAKRGYRPLVLERGPALAERDAAVARFFETGALSPEANIQFGEGGAGAYSDGKLNTRVGDPRCELVLEWLGAHGAPPEALLPARPHIGTDQLKPIVRRMREEIVALGGTVRFSCRVTGLVVRGGRLAGLRTDAGEIPCETAILALGHSARDSFAALRDQGVAMEQKAFSVGLRVEHLQADIDEALYGSFRGTAGLPPGEYVLAVDTGLRKCYSFCMCPGGRVVAAASEAEGVVTNGMSDHARDGRNANAAVCVPVGPADFGDGDALAGVAFQRALERAAFRAGGGLYRAPAQTVGDFLLGKPSAAFGRVQPTYQRGVTPGELSALLPPPVCGTLRAAFPLFARKVRAFGEPEAVLTGIETRTSSPVRILRGDNLESVSVPGLIPCGEGAGYAGGIVSAAADGLRAAEAVFATYRPGL